MWTSGLKYYDSNLKRYNFRYINIVLDTNLQLLLYLISVHKDIILISYNEESIKK